MALNPEMIKLISIIVIGLVIGIVGQVIILKRKKAKEKEEMEMMGNYNSSPSPTQTSSSENISEAEKTAKQYIEQYKNDYPRDSLKQALTGTGNSEADVEAWLNKYL